VTVAVLVMASSMFASHEHKVTVLVRNGDRVAGLLEDVEGGAMICRIENTSPATALVP